MKQKYTKTQLMIEALTLVILLSLFAYVITNWDMIPEQIPSHFNFHGQIDSWSDKNMIFFPMLVCLFLYLLLTIAYFHPSMWNMPVKITEENRVRAYHYTRNMITVLKLELVSVFAYITIQTSKAEMLSQYFLPLFLTVVFGTMALHIVYINKK
ncbi:MAG: hypothetical protein A4E24_01715 [Methanomethylovorans sp. PtaU1.Bin093]|uniref:DUF1648 domain-containing protein n=1 Tax=Methanomethylovorans sp. PtaU1.Bin093 TaxID=1811679 RepID=UPI0009C82B68|nr:DUF1648 domain-containing protein [Methanomethylovorans sp. PtaU1.Bin093]OPY19364.1 MAG: hypothetical protein A4E24_01715 [Methanomethylovorans sp. PtaU1.Bin093]